MTEEVFFETRQLVQCCIPAESLNIWGRFVPKAEEAVVIFIRDYVCKHSHASPLLRNLHKTFVLVGETVSDKEFATWTIKGRDIKVEENGTCILGVVVASVFKDICCIEWIESFYERQHIATDMLSEVKSVLKCKHVLPLDVAPDSAGFWSKIMLKDFDSLDSLRSFLRKEGFNMSLLLNYEKLYFHKKQKKSE